MHHWGLCTSRPCTPRTPCTHKFFYFIIFPFLVFPMYMSAIFFASDSIIMGMITNRIRVDQFLTQNWAPSLTRKSGHLLSILDFPRSKNQKLLFPSQNSYHFHCKLLVFIWCCLHRESYYNLFFSEKTNNFLKNLWKTCDISSLFIYYSIWCMYIIETKLRMFIIISYRCNFL